MYISIKLINKLFNCNIKHMLQGHKCCVKEQVVNEINELRIKFALYIEKISNEESLIYLKNNSLLPQKIKVKLDSINNNSYLEKEDIKKLKNIILNLKKSFPANESEIKKINFVYKIFQDSLKSTNNSKEKYDKDILTYNYKNLNNRIKNIDTNYNTKDFSIFKKAFWDYKIGNWETAYNELSKVSYETWKNKNYLIHVISCSYQYHLGLLLENYQRYDKNLSESLKNIIENNKNIETYWLIERYIKNDLKDVVKSVVDLSFFKEISLDIRKSNDNFEKMFSKAKNGSIGFSNSLSTLYEHIYDAYCFISNNYVMPTEIYECSELFKQFIQAMLKAYAVNEVGKTKEKGEPIYSGGMTCFDLFDLYIMIEFGNYEDIERICKEHKINSFVLEQTSIKSDIICILENFYYNLSLGYSIYNFSEKFKILLFILSKIELEHNDIEKIMNIFLDILNIDIKDKQIEKFNFEMSKIKVIGNFIIDIYNKYSNIKIFKADSVEKLLLLILKQIACMDFSHAKVTDNLKIIHTISFILNKNYKDYKFKNSEQMTKLYKEIKDPKLKVFIGNKIFKFINTDNNTKVNDEIILLYEGLTNEDAIELLYDLLTSNAIKPNKNTQNRILQLLKHAIKLQIANNHKYYGTDSIFCLLDCILYLLYKDKWKLNNELTSLINDMQKYLSVEFADREKWWRNVYKEFLDIINLYINIELVDFASINIRILSNINDKTLLKIKKYMYNNSTIKNSIIKNLLQNTLDDKNMSETLIKILE